MRPRSLFDRCLWGGLLLTVAALLAVAVLAPAAGKGGGKALDRKLERTLADQARVSLIRELYGPIEDLRRSGDLQGALLKLAEIEKNYPGEAHGQILKAELQAALGAEDEAIASYAAGVRLSGDYVDRDSSLSRRDAIQRLVDGGLQRIARRLAEHPDNRSAAATQKQLYYLQSRLAGGCE